jgi:WD40 repeat protein
VFEVAAGGVETVPGPASLRTANAGPTPEDGVPGQWQPGDVILNRYEVKEVFTGGGMGLVYRVWHRHWHTDLVVKSPRPEFFRSDRDRENFEREAELWVGLGMHPNVVSCFYVRRLGGIPRIFAEYVASGTLERWIRTGRLYEGGPQAALARVLDVAIQFAWGLAYAHEQGVVHQDVKPANVLLTPAGLVKVTDFGLARARGATAEAVTALSARNLLVSCGMMTPAYCSPEQAGRQRLTRQTDLWSWGVSVLELFMGSVGRRPGVAAAQALELYLKRGPDEERLPRMPPAVAGLLRRCFQLDPGGRPRDMSEVVAVLRQAYQEATGAAYPRAEPQPADLVPDGLNNRAVSLADLGKHDEADLLWTRALRAGPLHPEATFNQGLLRWRAGRLEGAHLVRALEEVAASRPGDWLPQYLLAQVHKERGDFASGVRALEAVAGEGRDRDEVRSLLAWLQERRVDKVWLLQTYAGHAEAVSAVCAAGDGRAFLSGSWDGTVRLWDAGGGCLRAFGHAGPVSALAWSRDGRRALSGSWDGTVRLWDVATGQELRALKGHKDAVTSVAWCADGRRALSASDDTTVKIWDAASGECLRTFGGHSDRVLAAAWSHDGRLALTAGKEKTVFLWDVDTGECFGNFEGHTSRIAAVAFCGDDGHFLSGSWDGTVRLWGVVSGLCLRVFIGHGDRVTTVAWGGDDRFVLSGAEDGTVRLWDAESGQCLRVYRGHTGGVTSVAWGEGSVLSASKDGTVLRWDASWENEGSVGLALSGLVTAQTAIAAGNVYRHALEQARSCLGAQEFLKAAHWLRQARSQPGYERRKEASLLWAELNRRLARRCFQGGWAVQVFRLHRGPVNAMACSPDGRRALSAGADRTVRLWDVPAGQLGALTGHAAAVTAVAWGGDGRLALSASKDKTVKVWDVASGRCLRTLAGHAAGVTAVSCSGDGRLALSGGEDHTAVLWDVAGGHGLRLLRGHRYVVTSVAFSADGRSALSGSDDATVKVWDVATGACLRTFLGHKYVVTAAAGSADGRYALSASTDETVRLWDVGTGQCLRVFDQDGHGDRVTAVTWVADGRYFLSAGGDEAVKLWDVADGRCLRTFRGHEGRVTAVSGGDGCFALSAGEDGTVRMWYLDWELEDNAPADWAEGARPYLRAFLSAHVPYGGALPAGRKPLVREIDQALVRQGRPGWTEDDFERLLHTLRGAGFGWLRPDGVRRELARMAAAWDFPPGT